MGILSSEKANCFVFGTKEQFVKRYGQEEWDEVNRRFDNDGEFSFSDIDQGSEPCVIRKSKLAGINEDWLNASIIELIGKEKFIEKYGMNSYKRAKKALKVKDEIKDFDRRTDPSRIMHQVVGYERV